MGSRIKSDFLFASPSVASGTARLLDWGNTFDSYNKSDEADLRAAMSDWNSVGDDLHDAMIEFEYANGVG